MESGTYANFIAFLLSLTHVRPNKKHTYNINQGLATSHFYTQNELRNWNIDSLERLFNQGPIRYTIEYI